MEDIIYPLRKKVDGEVFDYPLLMDACKNLKKPRDKVTRLLKNGDIIRVKKGLYIFGEKYRKTPIHLEVLANLIYGPSYISKEYALSFYGLIPERVNVLTSITTQKDKIFQTPLGFFTYKHLHINKYSHGISWQRLENGQAILMATPEKALADLLAGVRDINSMDELSIHLLNNLRISLESLKKFNLNLLQEIVEAYDQKTIFLLGSLLRSIYG